MALSPSWKLGLLPTPKEREEQKKKYGTGESLKETPRQRDERVRDQWRPKPKEAPAEKPTKPKYRYANNVAIPIRETDNVSAEEVFNGAKRLYYGATSGFIDVNAAKEGRPYLGTLESIASLVNPLDDWDYSKGAPTDNNYQPQFYYDAPGMVQAIAQAAGGDWGTQFLDKSTEGELAYRKYLNVDRPENAGEMLTELGGALTVPFSKFKYANVGRAAPLTAKIGAAAKNVAIGAGEFFVPGRQGPFWPTFAVAAPFSTAVMDGFDAAVPGGLENYTSIGDTLGLYDQKPVEAVEPVEAKTAAGVVPPTLTPEQQAMIDAGYELVPIASDEYKQSPEYQAMIDAGYELVPTEEGQPQTAADRVPQGEELSTSDKIKLGLFGTGAVIIGGLAGRQVLRSMKNSAVQLPDGSFVGRRARPQTANVFENLYAGGIQHDQVVRNKVAKSAKRTGQRSLLEPLFSDMDRTIIASTNTQTRHAVVTGELPESRVNIGPLAAKLDAMARELSPTEQAMVERAYLANTALDTARKASIKLGRIVQPQFTDADGSSPSRQALQAYVDIVRLDPRLAKYADFGTQTYRDMLRYRVEQEELSPSDYNELLRDHPNYVHVRRAVQNTKDTSFLGTTPVRPVSTGADPLHARNMLDGSGVQMGEAVAPLRTLPEYIENTIRRVKINKVQVQALKILEADPQSGVRRVPEAGDHTITVRLRGVDTHFDIDDDALRHGLQFNPTVANNGIAAVGRAVTGIYTRGVTGKIQNTFFGATTAFYEALETVLTPPKGVRSGILNEWLSKYRIAGKTLELGPLDPTGGPIASIPGFLRYLWDARNQHVAKEMMTQLIAENGPLFAKYGPQDLAAKQARLQAVVDASYKSMMEGLGILSHRQFVSEDALKPMDGMEGIMPDFIKFANTQAAEEAKLGGTDFLERYWSAPLAALKSDISSQKWARAFNVISDAMRNSSKYATFATNVRKARTPEEMSVLAAKLRRLGGDVGQRGGNKDFLTAMDHFAYANNALQPLAELGKRFADNPWTAVNIATGLFTALMWQTMAAYTDPEVAEELRNSTDEKNTSRILLPAGISIPMAQQYRPLWGQMSFLINDITGINDGNMNPDFFNAFSLWAEETGENWSNGDFSMEESDAKRSSSSMSAAVKSMIPMTPASSPLYNAFAAQFLNQDPGMASYVSDTILPFSGDGADIKTQDRSEMGGEGKLEDQAITAQTQKVITSIVGPVIGTFMESAMDYARAVGQKDKFGREISPMQAANVALSRMEEKTASTNGPIESLLYGNYEKLISSNDVDSKLYFEKKAGIDSARELFRKEFLANERTGADPRQDQALPTDIIKPEYQGTALVAIGLEARYLNKLFTDAYADLSDLKNLDKEIQNQRGTTIEQRNIQRNALVADRRKLNATVLYHMRESEERIRAAIGDPSFTYQDLQKNFKKYKEIPFSFPAAPMPMDAPQ